MNAPGWTRLPSFAACCRRLKGLSQSEQRGPVSTVSRSLLAPEIESRELCNSWRTRMSGRRQPPFNQRTEQNVCLLAPSSTVEMGRNNYGTILAIPVHWKYLVPGPWHVLSVQSRRRTAAAQLPSGLTCQSGLTLYVTVGRKGLGGGSACSSYALVQHMDYESFWINIQRHWERTCTRIAHLGVRPAVS